jgi:uncharacterized phage-associated protein
MVTRYRASSAKALEVILYLASKQGKLDFYRIVKIVFYADKHHLSKYGRPIVGGAYIAMPHGPVPDVVYSILKGDEIEYQFFLEYGGLNNDPMPFEVRDRYWVYPTRAPNTKLLSDSDMEALDLAYVAHSTKSFRELEHLTHAEDAYVSAVEQGRNLDYRDMIDDDDGAAELKRRDLERTSKTVAFV